jgi:hypothetical protein
MSTSNASIAETAAACEVAEPGTRVATTVGDPALSVRPSLQRTTLQLQRGSADVIAVARDAVNVAIPHLVGG